MASFSNTPPEIIEEIINALGDDVAALKACSQTCSSLLPSCRKCLFRTIHITPRDHPQRNLPRLITSFGTLLDRNPGISDYVRNFVHRICTPDLDDDDVLRVLGRLRRVQSFKLGMGDRVIEWKTLRQPFRDALLRLIHLRSISRLKISDIQDFPIKTLCPCANLVDLTLLSVWGSAAGIDDDEQGEGNFVPEAVAPQLQSFNFDSWSSPYVLHLLNYRRSDGIPVLDFGSVRRLTAEGQNEQDLVVIQALIKATQNLEVIKYSGTYACTQNASSWISYAISHSSNLVIELINGYAGLAVALMNTPSLSTLRKLCLSHEINGEGQDPLCGLPEALRGLSGRNVIEEIYLEVLVDTDCQCNTGTLEWGRLDAALEHGFPMLRHVLLDIAVWVFSSHNAGEILRAKLDELPAKCFPWLSKNPTVLFSFSTRIEWV
ncbi:uncharacterized protein LACBIDRAFT_335053 [Laccaria bicolor S238N-H82]|uniref:Predicted protein n=1 Tax=Laccaria bicolor (strain S238N-H82 / ATCC MYA-4686) TaxID=486041 RepID=B0E178_LACBS|nr:uncharacterized protein LACBIDRAFT_335053 [Laccaria bicolor S238N-H82]EDQ99411.1 predicted protein [Laccaria bicolor S238N-H82]|eukprot:XP_001889962.1 predicted protein [Laccaria bicolor S238N-H82]